MQQQFNSAENLEPDRISQEEAAAVVRLWAEKQRQSPPGPSTASIRDLAEGLEIPPEQAESLLQEVRRSRNTFRELPVTERPNGGTAALSFTALTAAGIFVAAIAFGSFALTGLALLALVVSLAMMRRWGLVVAAVALFAMAGLFVTLRAARQVQTATPVPESIAPPPSPPPPIPGTPAPPP